MSNDLVPSGGEDGSLIVSVDSRQAMAGLNTLEARLYGFVYNTQNMFNRFGGTFGNMFNNAFGRLGGVISGLTSSFGGLLAQLGKFLSLREVFNLFEGFIEKTLDVNRTITGFIASMSIIKGSVEAARKEYQFLYDVSMKLGIDLESSITQYHRLAAALKNVDTTGQLARNLFIGVSEAATVLHSRGRDVTLIFEAFQQMASKGKLSLEELQRQLGNTLPGAMSMAARAMMGTKDFIAAGVKSASDAEALLRKKIKDGTINVYDFLLQMSNQLKKQYADGAEYAAQQFNAAFNRMKTTIFNFFKEVGDAGVASGVTKVLKSITDLFDKGGAVGGGNLGKALGDMFGQIADWISKLNPTDIEEFFASVRLAITSTFTVAKDFLGIFDGIGGPEMETPMLNFVEFCAKTMGALVDIFRVAIAGIKELIYGMINLFDTAQNVGMSRADGLMTMASHIPGLKDSQSVSDYMAAKKQREADAASSYQNMMDADNMFVHGPAQTTFDKLSNQFSDARSGLLASRYGIDTNAQNYLGAGLLPNAPGQALGATGSFNAATGTPDYLLANKPPSWMTSVDLSPLSDDRMKQIQAEIDANSSAPNSGKSGKEKRGVFETEETRMIKQLSNARNEYSNVLSNNNLHEGQNEAQMRSLIATDARYIALSQEKKDILMAHARQLDDMILKLQNTKKAQEDWNAALVAGYDAQSKISELTSTGYENKYRNVTDTQNSFKPGGANEMMDELNKQRELSAAMKKDDDARLLDIAQYTAQVKNSNAELLFQSTLIGKSSLEQQKMIENHKIDLQLAQLSVGATEDQIQSYKKLAQVLKGDVGKALDDVYKKQTDALGGINASIQAYIDAGSDMASQLGQLTTDVLGGTEDALVSMCETGKASFADLSKAIIHDLIKMIVKYMLVMFLQKMTGMSPGGSSGSIDYQMFGGEGSPLAKGGVTSPMGLHAFANGGTFTNKMFNHATPFMFAGGSKFGVMGEAGPEAVMPLARNSSGELGVKIAGGGAGRASDETPMNFHVEVYVGKGDGVKTEKTNGPNGDIMKVIIGEVAADIKKGGQVHKAVTTVYGLRRTPKSYV